MVNGQRHFSDKLQDKVAAERRLNFQLGWFLDPIFFGDYPAVMHERLGDKLPKFSDAHKELLRNSLDFVGLNHYTTRFIAHATKYRRNPLLSSTRDGEDC
nr:Glyco_hydro_1 [uncultured bacterium]